MATQEMNRLTIKEYPLAPWIIGVIAFAIGLFFVSQADLLIIGLVALVVGLLFLVVFANLVTIQADRSSGLLTIEYRSLARRTAKQVSFSELSGIEIEHSHSRDSSSPTYRITLVKTDGDRIPLRGYYSSGYQSKEKKALQLSEFMGIQGPSSPSSFREALHQAFHQPYQVEQQGESSGVHWTVETGLLGNMPVTRWVSSDFQFSGSFLFLSQVPSSSLKLPGQSLFGGLSRLLYKQVFNMYGFPPEDAPGLDSADVFELPKPGLGDAFGAFTNDPYGTQQLLTPWVSNLLSDWAQRYPLRQFQTGGTGQPGQLTVLFAPQKLYLQFISAKDDSLVDALIQLGTGLVREAGVPQKY